MSENQNVYQKIVAITEEFSKIGLAKSQKNETQKFRFRGIDDLLYYLSPLLARHRLAIIPRHAERTVVDRPTSKGGLSVYSAIQCYFDFVSADDQSKHTASVWGEASDSGDKSSAKCASMAFKTVCIQVFCIPCEGNPEADLVTAEPRQAPQQSPGGEWVMEVPDQETVGDWRELVLHVTKEFKGKRLIDIPPNKLVWLMENFQAKWIEPYGYKKDDAILRAALNKAAEDTQP